MRTIKSVSLKNSLKCCIFYTPNHTKTATKLKLDELTSKKLLSSLDRDEKRDETAAQKCEKIPLIPEFVMLPQIPQYRSEKGGEGGKRNDKRRSKVIQSTQGKWKKFLDRPGI